MDELLTWWMSGPVGDLLASPLGAPAIAAGSVAAVAAGAGLGATYDRLPGLARAGVVTAALVVVVHLPIAPGVTR
jgi:hypothetical protein